MAQPDSLRTRRPSVSDVQAAPSRPARGPARGPPPSASSGASRMPAAAIGAPSQLRPDQRRSEVGARLLKKRQSVNYQTAHEPSWMNGRAPAMPTLPTVVPPTLASSNGPEQATVDGAGAGQIARSASPVGKDKGDEPGLASTGLDIELLASESFRPEEFLKQHLSTSRGATAPKTDDLRRLRVRLEEAMKITEGDLQRSVFKNYADFVIISKEIATLENEMLELKGVLEEWRGVPDSLESGMGDDDLIMGTAPNRRTQRNSLADLATLYKSQLSALWEGVEGSQKYLPFVPGRHLIAESASFIELNSATYKARQAVHLFLLNDAMLVSVKKRRGPLLGDGGKVRLVAERCFNLSEIVVVDLKDGGDLTNAVKIKRGKETIIFRTDRPEDKKALLMAFKKVAEELMNKRRKDILSVAEAREGNPSTLRTKLDYGESPMPGFSPAAILGFGKDDPTGKDLSWIGDYSDELAVSIAMRMFEEAVVLVEKGKTIIPHLASDPHGAFLFRTKLDERTAELVTSLLQDLADHSIRKSGVVACTLWLIRLGQGERAREAFLMGRGTLVRKRARQIKFEGDISMYISELAMVCFTLIKNTCEWYMAAFKDNRMASGFVRWASEEVEIYAETFRRQVYGADQDRKVIDESLEVTKAHGAMLRDVGLDFTFLLDGLLRPQLPPSTSTGAVNEPGGTKPGRAAKVGSALAKARQSVYQNAR